MLAFVKGVALGMFQAESESPAVRAAVKVLASALVAAAVAFAHSQV